MVIPRSVVFSDCISVLYCDFNDIKFLGAKRIDQAANMGVHVEMTGQGYRHFRSLR